MTHLSMGMRKAAVFPEPVWAHDMISRPAWMIGTAHFWTFSRFYTLRKSDQSFKYKHMINTSLVWEQYS